MSETKTIRYKSLLSPLLKKERKKTPIISAARNQLMPRFDIRMRMKEKRLFVRSWAISSM